MIDQKENGKKLINLYAVVVGCTGPRLTKRGDWVMTAVLIDETCTIPRTAVLFNKQEHKLPRLVCMGDILRIHRAGVEVRSISPAFVCMPTFRSGGCNGNRNCCLLIFLLCSFVVPILYAGLERRRTDFWE